MKLSRDIKTAILVLVGIALFIFGYNFLKNSSLLDSSKVFYVKYDNVAGLSTSAPVTINGLAVGKVTNIDFADKAGSLVVTFNVEKDFEFSKKSMVQIYSSGFIGGNNLGILPDMTTNVMAKSGDTLVGEIQSGMIDGIIEKFDPLEKSLMQTLSSLDTVLNGVNEVLDDKTKTNLRNGIASLNQTMANFNGISRDMNTVLSGNKDKFNRAITNLDTTTENFAKLSDSLAQINTGELAKNMEMAINKLNAIAEGIDNGDGSVGKLLKDEQLYDNLTGASKQLEQLLEDMKLNPKRYVHFSLFGKRAKQYDPPKDSID